MITGMYQTTIGAHHHRSSRGKLKIELPNGICTVPQLFRAAGYYTCNVDESIRRVGKDDYNLDYDRAELILHIDIAATSLALANIPIPQTMQSRPLLDSERKGHDYVVLARDRCDETIDRIRAIRMGDFKYIRNHFPLRPYLQPSAYKDTKPFMPIMRELFAAGKLNPTQ
jgi:arylsulfatase A-like enzyme